jgi:hypothetical protein
MEQKIPLPRLPPELASLRLPPARLSKQARTGTRQAQDQSRHTSGTAVLETIHFAGTVVRADDWICLDENKECIVGLGDKAVAASGHNYPASQSQKGARGVGAHRSRLRSGQHARSDSQLG